MNPDPDTSGSTAAPLAAVGLVRTRTRTSDRVYDELLAAILELRILPGTLLSEPNLAEQLQVSRTPLREAIVRLVETGLVSVVPQVGTLVEPIRLRDVEQARFVREMLESAAATEACAKPTRDVAKLRALLAEQKSGIRSRDYDRFFRADEAMHEQIFELSGYPGAWQVMRPMMMQLERVRRLSLPEPKTIGELFAEHTAIVEAVERGDARRARTLISKHARRVSADAPGIRAAHPEYFADE